jgi:hypothetical protein
MALHAHAVPRMLCIEYELTSSQKAQLLAGDPDNCYTSLHTKYRVYD